MFWIQYLLLIAAAALCSCATERTVATNFQPGNALIRKTDAELMDALEARGGFGQQTDKEGNTRMVSQNGVPLKDSGTAATRLKSKKALKPHPLKKIDGASTRFETKKWDGIKSFTDDKLETRTSSPTPGSKYPPWQDASKQYATQQSDFHGRSWKEADKRLGHCQPGH
ncbi:MAG: hypothetical protein ACLSUW_06925 [Akkermansia sp.]